MKALLLGLMFFAASADAEDLYIISPSRAKISTCTRVCIWEGPPFQTVCFPTERVEPTGCESPLFRHRAGEFNTIASVGMGYRPVVPGLEWFDFISGIMDMGVPIKVILYEDAVIINPPAGPIIFNGRFDDGDTREWSHVEGEL